MPKCLACMGYRTKAGSNEPCPVCGGSGETDAVAPPSAAPAPARDRRTAARAQRRARPPTPRADEGDRGHPPPPPVRPETFAIAGDDLPELPAALEARLRETMRFFASDVDCDEQVAIVRRMLRPALAG